MAEKSHEQTVEIVSKYLNGLSDAKQVADWAREHPEKVRHILSGYDDLASTINSVSSCSPLLEAMPNTKRLKATLNGRAIPSFAEMRKGNFVLGLREARGPMLYGQKIKDSDPATLTYEDKAYVIATPSMNTSLEALAVGVIGHLIERTFFQWAKKNGFVPKGGWKKDDLLQALDESLMLKLTRDEKSVLAHFFLKPNTEGGLGWLNTDKLTTFTAKVEYFQQNNTQ